MAPRTLDFKTHTANYKFCKSRCGWNFQIDSAETYQFTKYSKTQHYDWHTDAGPDVYDNGKTRKISMTINLEDGFNYEGGEFQIDHRNTNTGKKYRNFRSV